MDINGKTALITGGSSGIGRMVAEELCRSGANVIVASRRPQSKDDGRLITNILRCRYMQVDFGNLAQVRDLAAQCGEIDILVNNVGTFYLDKALHSYQFDEVLEHITVNLISHVLITKLLIKPDDQKPNVVICVSSVAGAVTGSHGDTLYGVAKAGLVGFVRSLALEYSPWMRAVAICPGFVDTKLITEPLPPEILEASVPLKRIGKPAEIARLISHVVDNDFINGASLVIDGGEACV